MFINKKVTTLFPKVLEQPSYLSSLSSSLNRSSRNMSESILRKFLNDLGSSSLNSSMSLE